MKNGPDLEYIQNLDESKTYDRTGSTSQNIGT